MALPPGRRAGRKKGEEGYGDGRASIHFGDDVLLDEEAMVQKLLACLEAPDYRPPTLPTVAVELLDLARQPDVDFGDVVRLLEQDNLIAGRILKLCRSAVYAGAVEITSLHDALARLGLRTLRDLVMEISMNMRVFKSPDYADTMDLLRRHATLTARLAKLVCKHTRMEGEYAFLAGLLHDVGIAGTLLALSERKGPRSTPPDLIAIWPAVDRVHQRAGELMASHWQLPEGIRRAIASHHQVLVGGKPDLLAATVCIADDVIHELGFGVIPKEADRVKAMSQMEKDCVRSHTNVDRSSAKTLEHARAVLALDEGRLELVRRDAAAIAAELD
jgi:putative nucleotidyltransferase with HDIG domain